MVDFKRYSATLEEINFIERVSAPIFLEVVLAIRKMEKPQSSLEQNSFQYLKRLFFFKSKHSHFHISGTSYQMGSTKKVKFLKQCFVGQIQVQKPTLVIATNQILTHSYSREYYMSRSSLKWIFLAKTSHSEPL